MLEIKNPIDLTKKKIEKAITMSLSILTQNLVNVGLFRP